jgi:hypothetical protein
MCNFFFHGVVLNAIKMLKGVKLCEETMFGSIYIVGFHSLSAFRMVFVFSKGLLLQ